MYDDLWQIGLIIGELYMNHPVFNESSLLKYIQGKSLEEVTEIHCINEPIRVCAVFFFLAAVDLGVYLAFLESLSETILVLFAGWYSLLRWAEYVSVLLLYLIDKNPSISIFSDLKLFPRYFDQLYVLGDCVIPIDIHYWVSITTLLLSNRRWRSSM